MNVGYATNPTDDSQSRGMTGFGATLPLVHEQQRTAVHVRSGHRSGPAATELLSQPLSCNRRPTPRTREAVLFPKLRGELVALRPSL